MEAGTAVNCAEEHKRGKKAVLADAHQFEPIAVETMGVYGGSTGVILKVICCRLVEATEDPREANWFRQNLAIAIQRGNALSILLAGRDREVLEASGESSPTHPLTCFLREFPLLIEILFFLF